MSSRTLYELNEHIRRALALNFPEPLWVTAEIAQCSESRGHHFLGLVQKSEQSDEIVARGDAVLWQATFRRLRRSRGAELSALLKEGVEVLLLISVNFSERYGLRLIIEDIDPAYTIGKLEQLRRQIIRRLEEEKLLDLNRRLPLPLVLQHIAVISSDQAAGWQDFQQQLEHNAYGYRFHLELFPAAMQGRQAETEILKQLDRIAAHLHGFDCVVITRGGGARLDLSAFDSYELGRAIAKFPLPVFTGIGHDIDRTVSDLVAHSTLKTPTAAADHLIEHNLLFETALHDLGRQIQLNSRHLLSNGQLKIAQLEQLLLVHGRRTLKEQDRLLNYIGEELPHLARRSIKDRHRHLGQLEQVIRLLSPESTLKRGFTLTLKSGRIVTSAAALKSGDRIRTRFRDGEAESEVG